MKIGSRVRGLRSNRVGTVLELDPSGPNGGEAVVAFDGFVAPHHLAHWRIVVPVLQECEDSAPVKPDGYTRLDAMLDMPELRKGDPGYISQNEGVFQSGDRVQKASYIYKKGTNGEPPCGVVIGPNPRQPAAVYILWDGKDNPSLEWTSDMRFEDPERDAQRLEQAIADYVPVPTG